MPVRIGAHQLLGGRNEDAARPIIHIGIGVQAFGELLRDQPRRHVGRAAGHQADDDADGLGGEILREGGRLRGEQQGRGDSEATN